MSEAALSIDERFYGSEREFENEKTPVMNPHSMKELMDSLRNEHADEDETVRSPGIPTLTSDRPTRPIRPSVMARYT